MASADIIVAFISLFIYLFIYALISTTVYNYKSNSPF